MEAGVHDDVTDCGRVGRVEGDDLLGAEVEAPPQNGDDGRLDREAGVDAPLEATVFMAAVVLANEAHRRLVVGVGDPPEEAFHVERGGVASQGERPVGKRADGGDEDEVGEGVEGGLEAGGEADAQHAHDDGPVDAQEEPSAEAAGVVRVVEVADNQECREGLRGDGRQGDALHVEVEDDD